MTDHPLDIDHIGKFAICTVLDKIENEAVRDLLGEGPHESAPTLVPHCRRQGRTLGWDVWPRYRMRYVSARQFSPTLLNTRNKTNSCTAVRVNHVLCSISSRSSSYEHVVLKFTELD